MVHETKIRVRYSETDRMGYVYYGHYAQYFEVARTEMLRSLGLTYKQLEDDGILLPVISMDIKYKNPAIYDDLLTIKTTLKKNPLIKIQFTYEVFNQKNELINIGNTTLVFVDAKTRKPRKAPQNFIDSLNNNGSTVET